MKPTCLILALTLCALRPASAQGFEKAEFKATSGNVLRYALLKPAAAGADKRYPLVLTLHGIAGRGAKNWDRNCYANRVLAKPETRKKFPCFVLAPTVDKPDTWIGKPMADVIELIESLQTKLPIDPNRICVTGQSMGGFGTFEAIARRPDLFAAAAPVCGGHKPGRAATIAKIPIWIFHGAKDTTVPVKRSREMVEALKGAGGMPKYTEFPNVGHGAWTPAYDNRDFWEWLFKQRRAAP